MFNSEITGGIEIGKAYIEDQYGNLGKRSLYNGKWYMFVKFGADIAAEVPVVVDQDGLCAIAPTGVRVDGISLRAMDFSEGEIYALIGIKGSFPLATPVTGTFAVGDYLKSTSGAWALSGTSGSTVATQAMTQGIDASNDLDCVLLY